MVSDLTRPVPNALILPPVFAELEAAGVAEDDVYIINGTGLHRENTPEELDEMLGAEIARRYRIVQHVARDRSTVVEVGRSKGVAAELCRAYVEADVRIVTGFVEPHLFAGYSGGPKGVMPGVAGADIVMSNHGAPNLAHPKARWGVTRGNPVWDEIDAITAMCPPHFLLNVTLDSARGVTGVFAGDLTPAHEAAIAQARAQYLLPIGHPYDVVVVTNMGYPADTTFYQAVKGLSVAAEGVREGGAILLVAGCEEGIGSHDYIHGLPGRRNPRRAPRTHPAHGAAAPRPVAGPVPGNGPDQSRRPRLLDDVAGAVTHRPRHPRHRPAGNPRRADRQRESGRPRWLRARPAARPDDGAGGGIAGMTDIG